MIIFVLEAIRKWLYEISNFEVYKIIILAKSWENDIPLYIQFASEKHRFG